MSDMIESSTKDKETTPPNTAEVDTNTSPSIDAVTYHDCGHQQDTQSSTAMTSLPGAAGTPQTGEQLVPPVDTEAAGDISTPEEPRSVTASSRAEAARRNGSKSHGPSTEEGKSRSRLNALKHGLRTETLLLQTSSEAEKAVFEDLRKRLEQEFEPRTIEEQLLFESLIHALWQKRRCLQFEIKELRQEFIFHGPVVDRILRYATSADKRLFRALNEFKRLRAEDPPQMDADDSAAQVEGD